MSDQPEALRLADLWEKHSHGYARTPEARTAACLRRQHAEIESLKAECDAMDQLRRAAGDRADGYKLLFDLSDAACKKAEAERNALRAELLSIGDLDKRHAIVRKFDLSEWADWAQNRARYATREEKRDE